MLAARPAFVSVDFEIADVEPSGCRDEIPFLEAGTTQDTDVGTVESRNSGAEIPLLDKNRSVLASKVDETVGAPAEERSFEGLNMFRIGRCLENEDEPPCLRTIYIFFGTKQPSRQRQGSRQLAHGWPCHAESCRVGYHVFGAGCIICSSTNRKC